MNYTHGGMPETEAYHWTTATYQRFGQIIFNLVSSSTDSRSKGYNDYYNMRRYFMPREWDEKMRDLDIFRMARKAKPIAQILEEIQSQIIKDKRPSDAPADLPAIPEWCELLPPEPKDDVWPEIKPDPPKPAPVQVVLKTENIIIEQLSLF